MGKSNIAKSLDELSKTDIYSLILFAIWKLNNIPEYSTLSELAYVLDGKNLVKFLQYYGGKTITIPTTQEFNSLINALLLYQLIDIEGKNSTDALKELKEVTNLKELNSKYILIKEILDEYDFRRS